MRQPIGLAAALVATLLVASVTSASAQVAPARVIVTTPAGSAIVGGITVTARASVRRPADLARFSLGVANRGTPSGGVTGASALVAALKSAGVSDAVLANSSNGFINAQQFATVTGSLRKPTLTDITALVAKVSASVGDTVSVQNANIALYLDDCNAAEEAAIVGAQADARARAERIAAAAHVHLGRVLAVNAQAPATPPCTTKPDATFAQFGGGGTDLAPVSTTLDVVVSVYESVTFEIVR